MAETGREEGMSQNVYYFTKQKVEEEELVNWVRCCWEWPKGDAGAGLTGVESGGRAG